MDATPIRYGDRSGEITTAAFAHLGAAPGADAAVPFARKWAALHEAAATLALLAGIHDGRAFADGGDYPATMLASGGWRLALADQGLDDLTAIMDAGLVALLSVHGHGADPAPAAQALWQEFCAARTALLVLAPPIDTPTTA